MITTPYARRNGFMAVGRAERPPPYEERLEALRRDFAHRGNVIVASNRGPLQFHLSPRGELRASRGTGGLVTALSALAEGLPLTWVACAMGAGEQEAVRRWGPRFSSPLRGQAILTRYLTPTRALYHRYYNVISNPLFWFIHHYMWDASYTPTIDSTIYDAWTNGYVPVNQAFAEAIAEEAFSRNESSPVVLFQDYHLYLAPAFLRERLPRAVQLHFIHIPWPAPRYWLLLPKSMRREICEGLCANDIVGLQTNVDARNFLLTCETFLPGAQVNYAASTVRWRGRETLVKAYPISVDTAALGRLAGSSEVQGYAERLAPLRSEWTIVRVDRMEPSKNILRGFAAYEALLLRNPQLQGRVSFLSFLVPSRTNLRQYQTYSERVHSQIQAINQRFGTSEWTPIRLFYEDNYAQAIAALTMYDILLVNPVIDGMNLVAKEGPTVNQRDGVLILSEGAGASERLGEDALTVAPADLEGTFEALYAAICMSPEERGRRAEALRRRIADEDITLWLWQQFQDLQALARDPA